MSRWQRDPAALLLALALLQMSDAQPTSTAAPATTTSNSTQAEAAGEKAAAIGATLTNGGRRPLAADRACPPSRVAYFVTPHAEPLATAARKIDDVDESRCRRWCTEDGAPTEPAGAALCASYSCERRRANFRRRLNEASTSFRQQRDAPLQTFRASHISRRTV